jgi:hypothetical protein
VLSYLSTQDVVVTGTLLDVRESYHPMHACPDTYRTVNQERLYDLTVRVSSVLSGVASDSLITIGCEDQMPLNDPAKYCGWRVVAYGRRFCEDSWRLLGNCMLVDSLSHRLYSPDPVGMYRQYAVPTPDETLELVSRELPRIKNTNRGDYDGAVALVLARVARVSALETGRGYYLELDGVRKLAGSWREPPARINVPFVRYCGGSPQVGDSILIPTHGKSDGPTLVSECALPYVVKGGFVASLNTSIDRLLESYRMERGRLRLIQLRGIVPK